ncbi:MAG: immunity 17 family protein [Muribaculaceae bacterium]|nr:immunity 17 family protein [Muribaculaceae bacterium]
MSLVVATIVLIAIFGCIGLFSVSAAIAGWEWFFSSQNSRMLTGSLPRKWQRIVYFLLGIAILYMAVYLYVNLDVTST